MYKVYFEGKPFASVPDIENACALALSVHRSSNINHVVYVNHVVKDDEFNIITFSLSNPKEK